MHNRATSVFETLSHKGAVVEGTSEFLAVRRALAAQKYKYVCLLLFRFDINDEDAGHQEESHI